MPQDLESALENVLIVFDACLMRWNRHFWVTLARALDWVNQMKDQAVERERRHNSVELDNIARDYVAVDVDEYSELP